MNIPAFFVNYEEVRELTSDAFARVLEAIPKERVGNVTLSQLAALGNTPNGLYIFYDENGRPVYVGKCTSRSFIDRIPSHFGAREDGWLNVLPKRILAAQEAPDLDSAIERALQLRLVLVGITRPQIAEKLERHLRVFLQPKYNLIRVNSYLGDILVRGCET